MEDIVSARQVRRVRQEPRRRDVRVAAVERLSEGFVAITFAGEALADFTSESFDDHVKFILGGAGGEPVRRDYTPRRFDRERRELTIEFALHGHGHASEWARDAAVGQVATIAGPRGSFIVPFDYDWHLLVGDATALPAISRRLEELPREARVTVIAQADRADRRDFAALPGLDVRWVDTSGELLAAVETLQLPGGEGYVWAAGEAAAMARVRQLLVDKGQARDAMRVAAYWKQGSVAHHENLEG
jgi:NADPH-dependent ferric siderophore reductase